MTYIEYLKLIHGNYTRFYMLTLLAFCASILFCSYSYGADLSSTADCNGNHAIYEPRTLNVDNCYMNHIGNLNESALRQCTYALRGMALCHNRNTVWEINDIPSTQQQIIELRNNRANIPSIAEAASEVFFGDSCGINGGTINAPVPAAGVTRIACARVGQLAGASGATYPFNGCSGATGCQTFVNS
ncbi:MAG: hypothetical protein HRT44_11525, partial [Bdellovibrionales bacterium]|nr:hypothetical protein [Bdellovibrionales bacterium]